VRLFYKLTKRIIDFTGAAFGLLLLSPLLLLVMSLIRIKIGKPIFYKQLRPGLNEKPFMIYKFRTMTDKRAGDGTLLPDKERLTKFGEFLRKSSIDELPELWNVLRGDMSMVGPRPLFMEYLSVYDDFQRQRQKVKPGITGWAQVNGRNAISWDEKFALDVWYVKNCTLNLDIKILYKTFITVFRKEGISAPGEATMPVFKGVSIKSTEQR